MKIFNCIKRLLAALIIFIPAMAFAQWDTSGLVPYLTVQTATDTETFMITDDLTITPTGDNEILIVCRKNEQCPDGYKFNLDDITALGIRYYEDTAVKITTQDYPPTTVWEVVSLDGTVVAFGKTGSPDLSGLDPDKIYIVREGNVTYKYKPIK